MRQCWCMRRYQPSTNQYTQFFCCKFAAHHSCTGRIDSGSNNARHTGSVAVVATLAVFSGRCAGSTCAGTGLLRNRYGGITGDKCVPGRVDVYLLFVNPRYVDVWVGRGVGCDGAVFHDGGAQALVMPLLRALSLGDITVDSPCYDTSHDPGVSHCGTPWLCFLEPGVSCNCTAKEQQCNDYGPPPITLTPALSQATSPGLPVGYNPETGTVSPENTTGATAPPATDYATAVSGQLPPPPCAGESWSCTYLGVGCVDSSCGPGFTTMLIFGGVVLMAFFLSADFVAGKTKR